MYIILKTTWKFHDGIYKGQFVDVNPGRHEVELIPNPRKTSDCNWIAIKGTDIGLAEGHLRDFAGEEYEDLQVIIED